MSKNNPPETAKTEGILKVDPSKLFDIADIMFDQGKSIIITVTGDSMYPFLRGNKDSVEICRAGMDSISVGDIVLVKRGGFYILHRVVKMSGADFYMIGDAQDFLDGPYGRDHLLGKVVAIFRDGKRIPVGSARLRFPVRLWMAALPFRVRLIRMYSRLRGGKYGKNKKRNK